MQELKDYALVNYIPIIRDNTAKKLIEICKETNPKKILEIGTAIGYSGIIMLKNCNGKLYTIEKDDLRAQLANENFKKFGFANRVNLYEDDALNVLKKLDEEKEHFDLIFLDGAKGQYIKYYPYIKNLLNVGGILFADNVFLHGLVKSEEKIPHKSRTMVVNLRKFIDALKSDEEYKTTFYDIDDGFSISKKI